MTLVTLVYLMQPLDEAYREIPNDEPIVKPKYTEVVAEVTAYTSSVEECGKDDGITASGHKATEGVTIAADDLRLGTKVIIGDQMYIVQDRFGGDYRNRIDIYMGNDVSRAMEFGRRQMVIKVLHEEDE